MVKHSNPSESVTHLPDIRSEFGLPQSSVPGTPIMSPHPSDLSRILNSIVLRCPADPPPPMSPAIAVRSGTS